MTLREKEAWLDAIVAWDCHQNTLSEPARVMLLHMGRKIDPDTMHVRISQRGIADAMVKDRRTVRRYLEQAVSVGFLAEREAGVKGKRTATYTATKPTLSPLAFRVPSKGGAKPWHDDEVGATGAHVEDANLGTRQAQSYGATGAHVETGAVGATGDQNYRGDHSRSAASRTSRGGSPDRAGVTGTPDGHRARAGRQARKQTEPLTPQWCGLPPVPPLPDPYEEATYPDDEVVA